MRHLAVLAALLPLTACMSSDDGDGSEDADDAQAMNEAYETAQAGGKADGSCNGVVVPDRSGFAKHIALTFDDGPNPLTTPKIISILKKHHAPAAFFNNGMRYTSAAAKALASQIAHDPDFILGNHSQNHIDLAKQSAAKLATEIDQTDALIKAAGSDAKWFRFPFGSSTCAGVNAVHQRGYTFVGWHIDSADWCFQGGGGTCKKETFQYVPDNMRQDYQAWVLSQAKQNNGGVILMHDIHQFTVDHLDAVLTALEQQGFTFVRIDNKDVFPQLNGAAAKKALGEACTANAQCGSNQCHAAGFCTQACEGYCPDTAGKAGTFCIANTSGSGGMCVAKAAPQNGTCSSLPDTAEVQVSRYIGSSTAPAASALVCAPDGD